MSTFSGPQGKGAMREHRRRKRAAAELRGLSPSPPEGEPSSSDAPVNPPAGASGDLPSQVGAAIERTLRGVS